jgi:serine protease Do
MNKSFVFIISIIVLVSLCSCAHRSGHNRSNESSSYVRESNHTDVSSSSTVVEHHESGNTKMDGAEVFSKYSHAVFMVFTSDGNNTYQGSGFFINDQGLAVSNYHVFKGTTIGDEAIKLEGDDNAYKIKSITQRSEENDFIIFVVDVSGNIYIPIANNKPCVGEKVYAIGSPRGLENTFSSGEVSGWRDKNLMQINALIDHGSSGGALINESGEVVGITSGSFYDGSQANLNYAWSIDVLKPYLKIK